MLYFTQLIFINEGKEWDFNEFEANVIPLMEEHGGEMIYRIRPNEDSFVSSSQPEPYEIHFLTFETQKGFDAYVADPRRKDFLELKKASVQSTVLVKGQKL